MRVRHSDTIPTVVIFEALLPWLLVTGGILCLGLGGSWLVDGASRIALRLGISPMVVGLTVVGFGTSMPEFAVSLLAALQGSGGLSLGNAVGSNIMNLLLVLGVAAVLVPIHVVGRRRLLYRDLAFGLVPAVILVALSHTGSIGRPTALLLLLVFTTFIVTAVVQARAHSTEPAVVSGTLTRHVALTVIGIAVLVGGSEMLVIGGVELAKRFGVSEALVGLTVVAFGTSLPELATSVVAVLKGQSEIGVGNVLGSNVFNLGLVVGTAFFIRPAAVPINVIRWDIPILVLATVLVGVCVLRDSKISRGEGICMLTVFAAYLVFLGIRIA
jgi:cation:H+ antiporter